MTNGRPPAITEVKRRQLSDYISEGFTLEQAARYIGCSLRTLQRQLRRDPTLAHEVADAELSANLDPEKHLRRAAAQNWRAAAWILERTDPKRFGRRAPQGIAPENVAAAFRRLIEVALGEFTDDDARNRDYDRLMAAADQITAALVNPATVRRRTPFTPRTDAAELEAMLRNLSRPPSDHDPLLSQNRDKSPPPDVRPSPPHPPPGQGFATPGWHSTAEGFVAKNEFSQRGQK